LKIQLNYKKMVLEGESCLGKEFTFGPTTHVTLGDIDNLGMGC
jgi:hypothetical protein